MLVPRLYGSPPDLQTKRDMNPTLLVSWWCTGFSLVIILIRLCGRFVRTEKLFREDKIMFFSLIPLLIRMGLVHVILIWGTNNTKLNGLTALEIHHRAIGSRLVLASRIFYAAFIWTAKFTVSEFLKRLVGAYWRKSYEAGLQFIRYFLLVTFCAVIVATLSECQPFDHYWQVVPDPGPKCREGVAQLITMGVCDMITDILLVIYPIPIVIASAMPVKRKVSLTLLFAMSLGLVAITAYRVPATISRHGSQQFRSVLASLEILAATAVSNAIVIGSFLRDRGAKKTKFKLESSSQSTLARTPTRRATLTMNHWGSDSDLVAELGMSVQPHLQCRTSSMPLEHRTSAVTLPNYSASAAPSFSHEKPSMNSPWGFGRGAQDDTDKDSISSTSTEHPPESESEPISPLTREPPTPSKVSFFDVGTLLDEVNSREAPSSLTLSDSRQSSTQDFAMYSSPHPTSRRSSRAFLSDVGGVLAPHREEEDGDGGLEMPSTTRTVPRMQAAPISIRHFSRGGSIQPRHPSIAEHDTRRPSNTPRRSIVAPPSGGAGLAGAASMDFKDAGGLLR